MPILTEASALALWSASRRRFISPIISALAAQVSVEDITDGIIDALLSRDDTLLAWLFERIEAAADRLDERLTWRNVRNDKLRDWLEANDDIYPHLLRGLRALDSSIGAEVERLSAYDTPEAAKADEVRALLSAGGGPAAGFFHLSGPSSEAPRSSGSLMREVVKGVEESSTALAVVSVSTEGQQAIEELSAKVLDLHRLLTAREEELAAARADLWALQSGEEAGEEGDDTTPAIEPEIVSEEEEGESDPFALSLPLPDLPAPEDVPDTRSVADRARAAIGKDRADLGSKGRAIPEQTASRAAPTARPLRRRD